MQRQSTQILLEFITSLYPESTFQRNPDMYQQILNLITTCIANPNSCQQAVQSSLTLTGISHPIERLNDILTVDSEPIPYDEESEVEDSNNRKKSRTWTSYEDNRLIAGIYKFGIDNWTSISRFVGNGRSRSQCSQRWQRGLDPHLSKDQWSLAEEANLLRLVQYYGEKSWTQIAAKIGNRSDVQCRYKYKQMQKDHSVQSKAHYRSLPYGPGVRKTHSNILPRIASMQTDQNQQPRFPMNPPQGQVPCIPPQSVVPQQIPQQPYFDQNQVNQTYQQMQIGNLRISSSVPSIQLQYYSQQNFNAQTPFLQKNPGLGQKYLPPVPPSLQPQLQQQMKSQNQTSKPDIPLPPPSASLHMKNNSSEIPDIFEPMDESFFDDNEFDAVVNNADMTSDAISSTQIHTNDFDTSSSTFPDDSVGYSLPAFDSDLFSII